MSQINRVHSSFSPEPSLPSSASMANLPLSSHPPPPSMLSTTGRAKTTPDLSINVPRTNTKFVVKDGDLVAEDEVDSDVASPASSICQSPGWDDMMGKKRKKEKEEARKKKKEKEKAEAKALAKSKAAAKLAEKSRNRLSKPAPPPNKRISRMNFLMGRSSSTPAIPHSTPQTEPISEESQETSEETHQEQASTKSFSILSSSRTEHGTPSEGTSVRQTFIHNRNSTKLKSFSDDGGFIGGLKLKLAEETSGQDRLQEQSTNDEQAEPAQIKSSSKTTTASITTSTDSACSTPASSIEGIANRTSQRWESIYEQAAHIMRAKGSASNSSHQDEDVPKIPDRSRSRTSYFPEYLEESSALRGSSVASQGRGDSPQRISGENYVHGQAASTFSSRPPSVHTNKTPMDRGTSRERGRVHTQDYYRHHTSRSNDRTGSATQISSQGVESHRAASSSRGRSISVASTKNSVRTPSVDEVSTIKSASRPYQTASTPAKVRTASTSSSRPVSRDNIIGSPAESSLHQRRSSSKGAVASMHGIRNVAKAVFTRNPTVESPTESNASPHAMVSVSAQDSQPGHRPNTASFDARSLSKVERFFGQSIAAGGIADSPTESQYSTSTGEPSPANANRTQTQHLDENKLKARGGDHSRSTTDSSEGYSTLDDSSGVTTPLAFSSNLSSYRKYSPEADIDDLVYNHNDAYEDNQDFVMTNAVPSKAPGTPRFPSQDAKSSMRNSSAPQVPPIPTASITKHGDLDVPSIGRQPSLTRSTSTPELQQDLSFLPALKHQPLTKPSRDTPTSSRSSSATPSSRSQRRSTVDTGLLVKPNIPGPLPTRVENQNLNRPMSSQYLQNARLSIPKPPSRPISSMSGQGQEPIAKMFVVCCACKYFHDMPSKIYECMARSESVVEDKDLGVSGVVSTSVRCPWCAHGMTTSCCAGYAAVVMLREKLH